ncbi:MAG: methyl-accepting chemotaxis protein [Eubacterium sp.]|jgi:methyl-accepting chemotaxis protein|nr:methyl-accepting chemotaxis protein [Eubacterium sp.]
MKNMKVRAKIILSFCVIITLMFVFAVYIIASNISTNSSTKSIRDELHMQTLCTSLSNYFSEANKSLLTISYTFDDKEYEKISGYINECLNSITQMKEIISLNPSLAVFDPEINAISSLINNWKVDVDEVQANNKTLETIIERSRSNQKTLTDQSAGIFDYQMELSNDEARQDLPLEERLSRIERIDQGMDISYRLNYIGGAYEVMFTALDLSKIGENQAFFDETVTVLEDFLADSGLQYNIDTTTAMLASLDVYNKDINEFISTLNSRNEARDISITAATKLMDNIKTLLDDVEASSISFTDGTIASSSQSITVVIIFSAVALVVSIFMALYISENISKPLSVLTKFMKKAGATGDVSLNEEDVKIIESYSINKDEIGQCIGSTAKFIAHIGNISDYLEIISNGDLTIDAQALSDKDIMGNSLNKMVKNLSGMFGEIHSSTTQVASGSKQIADGAQSLAQGSTQQAATVEQLSSSISLIADKTKTNSEMTDKAAKLSESIKGKAERGNQQMGEMMKAVEEITDASSQIEKVIKVIDDIAFQTNILALNAAVEAARAGDAGKGFAVVAEEVRNLASKSAEAAKNTGGLIENSIEKANLGLSIATETSASLKEIVEGINESAEIVRQIAVLSDEQAAAVAEVNTGIDQVAQVVQQNSATAQESAAASEEMSGQSSVLEDLIAQFKLRKMEEEIKL